MSYEQEQKSSSSKLNSSVFWSQANIKKKKKREKSFIFRIVSVGQNFQSVMFSAGNKISLHCWVIKSPVSHRNKHGRIFCLLMQISSLGR